MVGRSCPRYAQTAGGGLQAFTFSNTFVQKQKTTISFNAGSRDLRRRCLTRGGDHGV